MKKWFGKALPAFFTALTAVAVILIGVIYFNFISDRIYEDSTGHLREIYGQVNSSFGAFLERNWGLLDSWSDYLGATGGEGDEAAKSYLEDKQSHWSFSEFYFLSSDKHSLSLSGEEDGVSLTGEWELLMDSRDPVIAGESLSTGQEVTLFAVPSEHGVYRGFEYDAIALTYTNADLASSLNVNAFGGRAKCFVIHGDGNVLLSTRAGGSVFGNLSRYFEAASDMDPGELQKMCSDWASGGTGIVRCRIADETQVALYEPVGYQDYVLLAVVPESTISAGFLSVQQTTIYVLILIFTILCAAIVTAIVLRGRRRSRLDRMEVQSRELMFNTLSQSVDDIFLMLDISNRRIDYLSPNVTRLLGIDAEEAQRDIRVMEKCAINGDVFIPKDEFRSIPLHGSILRECEYMHQTTGERRWYRLTVYHVGLEETEKYIIVMSDRTHDRQLNQNLQEALNAAKSANEAKSNFLSNMSHDIRTPMNAIVGFSVLLEKDADKPEKVREYTRKIMASSHHLLSLINDVLDMSKIESGKTSLNVDKFSLPELLSELSIILMPQARAKKQDFSIHVQGVPCEEMLGDKLRLNQILINLLSNAIKYTPVGGKIDFTITDLPAPAPQFAKLRFVVRDNGIGMSEEFQKQIFAPFSREINSVTNKIQGTGLGMAITKNLVDLMGGVISLESAPGEGSTFTLELSFALPEEEESESWFRHRITRMLVADDEEEICLDIREMMRDAGVEVDYVTDGQSAVERAVSAESGGAGYHVILLDWKMPGMTGVEAAREIRERVGSHIPILVLTSYDWAEIEDEAREAGINAFMSKPFFASTFWRTIRPLCAGQETADKPAAPAEQSVLEGRVFLVAEDNELNAEILTEMLDMEGARCDVASDGSEAVEKFLASPAGSYDMILMDVQMPIMNGYEATRAIRSSSHPEARTIPIVAMTANTFAEDVHDAMEAGMDGHLGKPIDMDAVRELIGRLLSREKAPGDIGGEDNEDKNS